VLSRLKGTIVVLSALILLPAAARAQVPALSTGSIIIGGQASITVEDVSGEDDKATSISVLPSLQYFVRPALAIGGELRFVRASFADFSLTSFGIGPTVSYYFVQDGNAHPFLRGSLRYDRSSTDTGTTEVDSDQLGLRASVGLLLLLSESVGVDAVIFFDRTSLGGDGADFDRNALGLAAGISAFLF
jgi:hypothetical protein